MAKRLTTKQKAFVEAYLSTFNATEAARIAKYKGNRVTLQAVGAENLRKPLIKAIIDERMKELAMGADEILARLTEQAQGKGGEYVDMWGNLDFARLKAEGKLHLIKKIKPSMYGKVIEFYDAQSALALLGKTHKLFVDLTEKEHKGEVTIRFLPPHEVKDE